MARTAQWVDTLVDFSVVSAGQGSASLMGGMTIIQSRGLTATRVILALNLIPPTSVSDGYQNVDFGIGVVAQEAFGSNILPDSDEATNRSPRGWLYRSQRVVAGAASMVSHAPVFVGADVRGKRKVDDGELLFIVDSNPIDGTAFTVQCVGLVRVVFLLQ